MAEEVLDASRYVPISLFWSYIGNSLMAVVFLVGFLFAIPDVEAAVTDSSGYPFLYVFKNAMNTSGVNALTIIVLLLVNTANVNFGASTARQTFAFARDRGLPFASWIAKVDTMKEIPSNAILLSSLIAALLSLINIGSTTAFNAIISLQVVSLMFTYTVSISCVLYRRVRHPELLPRARWSLGKLGVPINLLGLAYTLFSFFWSFWPTYTPVTAVDFNWSVLIFVTVLIFCVVVYFVEGKRVYKGPVQEIRKWSESSRGSG
jgi:amino acid transporter